MSMKKLKRVLPFSLAIILASVSLPVTALADSAKVVTLGANLSDEQKASMYKYFGTSADQVDTIEVTNTDERKYMEGIATESQIGTRTYSCSYVEELGDDDRIRIIEPLDVLDFHNFLSRSYLILTDSGGIQVKVANLTFVTSSMIASTLLTSGVENCNVVAGSPIEVSGTGALTGIMMAYEKASGKELSEDQKATATEELVTTGDLAKDLGQDTASDLINDVKESVIEDKLTDPSDIQDAISDAADKQGITLTDDQLAKITSLMESISQYDYDVKALKKTLDNLDGKSGGFFSNLWSSIKGFFGGDDSNGGIINNTDDAALGNDAIIDSTLDAVKNKANDAVNQAKEEGLWDKIVGFFKDLFGGDDTENSDNTDSTDAVEENTDNNTDTGSNDNNADNDTSDNTAESEDNSEDNSIGTENNTTDNNTNTSTNAE